tara:strand:- start:619 stop:1128 length:510 start_codon:yes stop_codon:yes gene_type:complete
MRGWKYHQVYKAIKPGDIILTVDNRKLTTKLIPGEWAHAAVCVSKDKVFEVAEMTHTDYTKSTVADLCFEADRVRVLRGTKFTYAYRKKFIEKCISFEGVPYDDQFVLGVKALSCSELVWASDFEGRLGLSLKDIAGLGREYISPTGIFKAKNVNGIIDTDSLVERVIT